MTSDLRWPALKHLLLKSAGYLSVGMILMFLGRPGFCGWVESSSAAQLSAEKPVLAPKQEPLSEEPEKLSPAPALSWLLDGLTAIDPQLVFKRSTRIMHNGRFSWERIWLKGVTGKSKALAGFLERARENLNWNFNYHLLLSSNANRGSLNFLILDGFEVVVVANFTAAIPQPEPRPESKPPRLAIVIDDLGRSLENAARFAALPLPLTFAVFPKLHNSRKVARYFVGRQRDIMLHMPMEPRAYPVQNPGPGALLMTMNETQLKDEFTACLKFLPGIIGVNNHMGSRLTTDSRKMAQVMDVLKGWDLFFLDSRTIAGSVAYQQARAVGIPALQRDVFLDNERDVARIIEQLRVLIEIARIKKSAIGIGHPYPETLKALARFPKIAESAGVRIVAVRKLLADDAVTVAQ